MAQAGTIIHELCHILLGHRTFVFLDRHEPEPDRERPAVIVEGEKAEKATDLRVILGERLTEQEEAQANGLAMVLGFEKELRAASEFMRRGENYELDGHL